jgi:hypothetical protein
VKVQQTEPNITHRKQEISPHVSGSQPSLDISPIAAEVRKLQTTPSNVGTLQRICLVSNKFYSDRTLISTAIAMKQCMDIGNRPHVCGVPFNAFNIYLKSHRWFEFA